MFFRFKYFSFDCKFRSLLIILQVSSLRCQKNNSKVERICNSGYWLEAAHFSAIVMINHLREKRLCLSIFFKLTFNTVEEQFLCSKDEIFLGKKMVLSIEYKMPSYKFWLKVTKIRFLLQRTVRTAKIIIFPKHLRLKIYLSRNEFV